METEACASRAPRALRLSQQALGARVALFVGLNGDHTLQRINLASGAVDRTFSLPLDPSFGPTTVKDMHVVPGSPQNVVDSLAVTASPSEDGSAIFTDSGLAAFIPNDPGHTVYSLDS